MYAVVGCSDCSALWVVEGRPDSTECPRCGKRHPFAKRRQFVTTDDRDHAREVRASMLAARQDEGEAFAGLDSYAEMEAQLDDAGVDDREYLEAAGIDPGEVETAAERATRGAGGGQSDPEVVRAALRELDPATGERVREYAAERGVDPGKAEDVLDRLVRRGEAVRDDEGYRLL